MIQPSPVPNSSHSRPTAISHERLAAPDRSLLLLLHRCSPMRVAGTITVRAEAFTARAASGASADRMPTACPTDRSRARRTWPDARGRRVVFLLDAATASSDACSRAGSARHQPGTGRRERRRRRDSAVARAQARQGRSLGARGRDPPGRRSRCSRRCASCGSRREQPDGTRVVRLRDVLLRGDPFDPSASRQRLILARERERCRIVAGEPAPLSELRERWRGAATARPATPRRCRSSSRARRSSRSSAPSGACAARATRCRASSARRSWRGRRSAAASRGSRASSAAPRRTWRARRRAISREIAAAHNPITIDLATQLYRFLYTRGYDAELRYDHARLEQVAALSQRYPVVFLPTHRSNLDHPSLHCMLCENGLPPNHTAGGINMNFFPIGPLVRRAGVFFIRRTFKDDEVYKLVLHHYVDYLIEKRFSLEWYIEGGRSRSGKLLPPRYGMLAYVVDAYRRGKSDDVYLIPVSIAYDQIQDVGDYVAEQRGAAKQKESFGWFLGLVRRLRRYGEIHIRFGEPISLAERARRAQPARRAESRRGQPRDPEARVRGVRAHQRGDADQRHLARDAGPARRRRSGARRSRRSRRSLERIVEYVERTQAADLRELRPAHGRRRHGARSTSWCAATW